MNSHPPLLLRFILPVMLAALFSGSKARADDSGNRPYVQSGPGGAFYARCIPQDISGSAGSTAVYRVEKARDELVGHFDWHTKHGVVLGWSPIAGKVAVMAIRADASASPDKRVELSFYLGERFLRSWSTAELKKLGTETSVSVDDGERAVSQALGCEQMAPGTNQYAFAVQIGKDKKASFDILTGDLFHQ